jgi:hypothetical protein
MNSIREIEKINQEELDRGIAGTSASWHSQYEKSPWVYVGNLDHQLTEGRSTTTTEPSSKIVCETLTEMSIFCRKQF